MTVGLLGTWMFWLCGLSKARHWAEIIEVDVATSTSARLDLGGGARRRLASPGGRRGALPGQGSTALRGVEPRGVGLVAPPSDVIDFLALSHLET